MTLSFEPWEAAEYVWLLVLLLAVSEWLSWSWSGRVGVRRKRFVMGGALLAAGTAAFVRWVLASDVRVMTGGVIALGGLAAVWARRSYASTTRPVGRRERVLLLCLRLAAVLAVIVILMRPVVRSVRVVEERGTVAMLLDSSRSMTIRDAPVGEDGAPRSRLEQLHALFRDNRVVLERIRRAADLRLFVFDTALRPTDDEVVSGKGASTALANAVRDAQRSIAAAGRRPVGVLVFSDGCDNASAADPLAVADELAGDGVALWAVGLGSELPAGESRGLVARWLNVPGRVGVLNRLPVRADILALGLSGRDVRVELWYDDEKVDAKVVRPGSPRELLSMEFEHVPSVSGPHKVTVRATVADREIERCVATISQFVFVTKGALRILYVDRPRYERAAIARALEPARELRLHKVELGRTGGAIANPLPRTRPEWFEFDAVILGELEPGLFEREQLEWLRGMVLDSGRGLLVIGSQRGLAGGAFAGTPLADVLPMDAASQGRVPGPLQIEPTAAGLRHPICRLAPTPDETKRLWSLLPKAPSACELVTPKPAAATLLATAAGQPVLLVQEVGAGRAAALALDSTWEWPLAIEEGREIHSRFWRQLVLWLANRPPSIWATTNRPRYSLPRLSSGAEEIVVDAGVVVPGGETVPRKIEVTGQVTGPKGSPQAPRPLHFIHRGDQFRARFETDREGEYAIEVKATIDGMAGEPARVAFMVESPDIEMEQPTANFELLRQMAGRTAASGGGFATAEHAGPLLERILAGRQTIRRTVSESSDLMARVRWPLFTIIVGLLVTEWLVRKRCGLP